MPIIQYQLLLSIGKYMVSVKLKSDFRDFYDHHFDNYGRHYNRYTEIERSRKEDLDLLRQSGFYVPEHGIIHNGLIDSGNDYVVYIDEYLHKGEGKLLISSSKNDINKYKGKFYTKYINDVITYHWRFISIGYSIMAWIYYTSDDFWRSNCGNVNFQLVQWGKIKDKRIYYLHNILNEPLIAVDGRYLNGTFIAFDLNTAPQIKETGLEFLYSSKEIVDAIKNFLGKGINNG